MSDKERVRRPALERAEPRRTWANVISPGPSAESPTATDVQGWYRVLEEQWRAGEASARIVQSTLGAGRGNGDAQDFANRMVRAGMDFMGFWLELLARSTGAPGQPADTAAAGAVAAGAPPPVRAARNAADAEPFRFAVDVDSARPTRVAVDLRPRATAATLCLGRLQPRSSDAPPIAGAEIGASPDDDSLIVIRLRVGADQPAGVYDAVILDSATSLPVGTISVEVEAAGNVSQPERHE